MATSIGRQDIPWVEQARAWIGLAEGPGTSVNPAIRAFYADAGHPEIEDDGVAWCAAFVGACLRRSGIESTGSLMARSYLAWGEPLERPREGAIAVLKRGANPAEGHVGFFVSEEDGTIRILGGNQGDRVCVAGFPRSRLLGYRWPRGREGSDEAFERALTHVLSQEGGYVDDPSDAGGPTNQGITLATLAMHLGEPFGDATRDRLVRRLKDITPGEVANIYRRRYWQVARCDAIPIGLAAMHFDAAVNHGTARAARMLQTATGAFVDGEIGVETLQTCWQADEPRTIERYAIERQAAYRRLTTFKRFGKGWLNRVMATRAFALSLARPQSSTTTRNSEKKDMTVKSPIQTPKWWGQSATIWGVAITALTAVLPSVGPLLGLEISAELAKAIGGDLMNFVQGGGGVIGTLIAIYGRLRARGPLVRRQLSLTL
ncbi:MAG: TIGR02594 family protein [Hyphomicrobiaceae bacterium]